MDEQETRKALALAKAGLTKALEEGRGTDALAMLEVIKRLDDAAKNWRLAEAQAQRMNALGRGP